MKIDATKFRAVDVSLLGGWEEWWKISLRHPSACSSSSSPVPTEFCHTDICPRVGAGVAGEPSPFPSRMQRGNYTPTREPKP